MFCSFAIFMLLRRISRLYIVSFILPVAKALIVGYPCCCVRKLLCVRYKIWEYLIDIAVISYVTKFISFCVVHWISLRSYCSMFVVCAMIRCNLVRLNFSLLIFFRLFWIWWIILFAFSILMLLLKSLMCDWSCCLFLCIYGSVFDFVIW
jgi:hypothetical protein